METSFVKMYEDQSSMVYVRTRKTPNTEAVDVILRVMDLSLLSKSRDIIHPLNMVSATVRQGNPDQSATIYVDLREAKGFAFAMTRHLLGWIRRNKPLFSLNLKQTQIVTKNGGFWFTVVRNVKNLVGTARPCHIATQHDTNPAIVRILDSVV
jgi:hypothetical protein